MKTSLVYSLTTIAALLMPSVLVRADNFQYPGLNDLNALFELPPVLEQAKSVRLVEVADAPYSGGQCRKDRFARPRQPRQHMLHDQRGPDRIQRKGAREIGRIELPQALLGCLAIIMQKSRRIDHQTKLTLIGGKSRGTRKTAFVQKVNRWRSAATERDYMLELFRGRDGFDECPSNTAAGAKNDRHAGLGKRPNVSLGSHCAFGFRLPRHKRLAPPMAA